VIDEAYIDFGGDTAIPLVERYPNLLIVQTMSKARSLAGLRVAFAVGQPDLIDALERVKNSFNSYPLDRLAIAGGVAALRDRGYFNETRTTIMRTRDILVANLSSVGFDVLPSSANFVFARHSRCSGAELYRRLRQRGILVRHFDRDRISQFLRISVGTPQECDVLIHNIKEILQELSRAGYRDE
jgi:histidinol-phosphate aminotransferase